VSVTYSAGGTERILAIAAEVTSEPTFFHLNDDKKGVKPILPETVLHLTWTSLFYNLQYFLDLCTCTHFHLNLNLESPGGPAIEVYGLYTKNNKCKRKIKERLLVIGSLFSTINVGFHMYKDGVFVLQQKMGADNGNPRRYELSCPEYTRGSPKCYDLSLLYPYATCLSPKDIFMHNPLHLRINRTLYFE